MGKKKDSWWMSITDKMIRDMPMTQLDELISKILVDIEAVQEEIDWRKEERRNGFDIDEEWLVRARFARKGMGHFHRRLVDLRAHRTRQIKNAQRKAIEACFIEVARREFSPEEFTRLMDLAHQMKDEL